MKTKKIGIIVWLLTICTTHINSQTIEQPNIALKSHETLEISKVEITSQRTVISFSVENRITGSNFCADKNIFIIYPDGSRLKLTRAANIPVCPDTYNFKSIGEKLQFALEFPPLKAGTEWIDLIEDCTDNCFSFYGVTLNNDLNKKIDEAFSFAEEGETSKAITLYKSILYSIDNKNLGIEGALFTDIITLTIKSGDKTGAEECYGRLLASKAQRLDLYIKNLNSRGIKY